MSTASHESLSAAYASAYDYLDTFADAAPAPPAYDAYPQSHDASSQQQQQQQQHQHQQQYYSDTASQRSRPSHQQQQPQHQQHHNHHHHHHHQYLEPQTRQATPPTSTSPSSVAPSGSATPPSAASLSRTGGSVGSSGSQSFYSSAQQPYPSHLQQHQPYHPQYPRGPAYPSASGAYPDHAKEPLRSNTAAYPVAAPPTASASMYAQSNISMPALNPSIGTGPGSRAPPLADDLGDSFANMKLLGTPSFGPQRSRSPAPGMSGASTSVKTTSTAGVASASSVRANASYANQEIHQSAAEVHPENSLAAIADELDQTAAGLDQNAGNASHGSQPALNGSANPLRGSGGSTNSTSHSNNGLTPAAASGAYNGHYGSGVRQHSAPGEYPTGSFAGSADGHGMATAAQMGWDPTTAAAAAAAAAAAGYYPNSGAAPANFASFQPQAAHHAAGAYPFAGQPPYAGGPAGSSGFEPNPYFTAASGYLGFPDGSAPGFPPGSMAAAAADPYGGAGMMPMAGGSVVGGAGRPNMLSRQGTQMSMMSGASSGIGLSSNPRRKSKDSAPQQTLPFNKSFVTEYRQRMKGDPDPEAQFAFAKYLIEAAKKVHDPADGPKQQRKYRDALLSESLKLIKRLATTGMGLGKPPYAEAQFFLANCFGNGSLGLQVDHEKAYNLYVQASKQNHPAATYRTAVCNEVGAGTRRDHHRAVLFYRKASALGDTAGMYKLGMVLLNGMLGQPRNVREAIVWLKRAAAQADEDNPHALHELGLLHEKPTNGVVLHDEAYARELFTQAAQLGYAPSQFKLGSAYEYGNLTCPVDPRRSIAWYTKAAGKGDGESELALSGWYLTGSEGVLKQSDSEAYLWARRAASKGIPKAEYAVGYYSEVGIGVESNLEEAKRWYMRAAAQGNKRAMQRLTELKKMKAAGMTGKKGARPTRKDAETECVVM